LDIKEYISSGILEMYVMGMLSEEENMLVEEYAEEYPEVKQEIERIEEALKVYAETNAPAPPESVKANIFERLDKKTVKTVPPVKRIFAKSVHMSKYLAAASFALFLLSGLVNIILWGNLKESRETINELAYENIRLSGENRSAKETIARTSSELEMLQNPEYRVVKLKGMEKAPGTMSVVFWNENTKHVYMQPMQLPPPPQGKQYQLWAIAGGKPVDAGVLDPASKEGMHRMKTIPEAEAFAVTLEPMGGSVNPTMDEMYVFGKL
jgi:anti-sigma-K factor RskA